MNNRVEFYEYIDGYAISCLCARNQVINALARWYGYSAGSFIDLRDARLASFVMQQMLDNHLLPDDVEAYVNAWKNAPLQLL